MAYTKISLLIALLTSVISSTSFAAGNRTDYDLDDDGLIEINNWADLNEIRNNVAGKLYGTNLGCPVSGCIGYELTTDLDFDTNGDGKLDAGDTYWNDGLGWAPLITSNADFEGNGHLIRNLMINTTHGLGGLFANVDDLNIRNLGLTGKLMSIKAQIYSGGFVGLMVRGSIIGCFSTGRVASYNTSAGGLVGASHGTKFKAVFSSALVESSDFGGGLVGSAEVDTDGTVSLIDSSYAVGKTLGAKPYGGLAGFSNTITSSYWATDVNGAGSSISNYGAGSVGATLDELKCSTSDVACNLYKCPDDVICSKPFVNPLYVGWDKVKDAKGNSYWDFGTAEQLPGLVLNGTLYRDSDGNGVLDSDEQGSSSSISSVSSAAFSSASSSASVSPSSASSIASSNASSVSSTTSSIAKSQSSSSSVSSVSVIATASSVPGAASPVADNKSSGGGSADIWLLLMLGSFGVVWRRKASAETK